jgi:hypothetical protein
MTISGDADAPVSGRSAWWAFAPLPGSQIEQHVSARVSHQEVDHV